MTGVLIGLDVGTTSAKAVATTPSGAVLGVGREPLTWTRSRAGTEIDARHLLAASMVAISGALEASAASNVAALGVASMGEASVLLDSSGQPLAPVIAWHDTRDDRQLEELGDEFGQKEFMAETGLPFRQQWSVTKHRWQSEHDPRVGATVTRLGVAEWVVRALGGDEVCEQSLASRTGWLKLHERRWWDEVVAWSGLPMSALPDLVEAGTPAGCVTRSDAPSALIGATLTVAGHDHQAAAVGADATQLGTVLDSCGTAEALVRTINPGLDRHAVVQLAAAGITAGWHAEPGRWCLLGGTQGGLALQRVLAMLGLSAKDIACLDSSPSTGSNVSVGGVDEGFLEIRGIGDGASPSDVWHAALRAVTGSSERINAAMTAVAGPHTRFVVTGGWAASEALIAAKQAVFGSLELSRAPEAGARGAARFAAIASGVQDRTGSDARDAHNSQGGDPE